MTYKPNNWVIVKIMDDDGALQGYKVLGGWSGGYLDGDSWRMNSGITSYKDNGDSYSFYGFTGSEYKCNKGTETVRLNMAEPIKMIEEFPNLAKIVDVQEALETLEVAE